MITWGTGGIVYILRYMTTALYIRNIFPICKLNDDDDDCCCCCSSINILVNNKEEVFQITAETEYE